MHEMGIANSVLEAVRTEAARYPGAQPRKVALRIGELAAKFDIVLGATPEG